MVCILTSGLILAVLRVVTAPLPGEASGTDSASIEARASAGHALLSMARSRLVAGGGSGSLVERGSGDPRGRPP